MKKIISWNVNGIRACMEKGFMNFFGQADADIFCIQETKAQEGQAVLGLPGYRQYWNDAVKKGYSGTAVFTKEEPLTVSRGMIKRLDTEGRILTLEYPGFYLVDLYAPNSQEGLKRLAFRMEWEDDFRAYLLQLTTVKPVIVCGDFNVAHEEIDLKNPAANRMNAGFTDEEREKFTTLLNAGFVDTFRYKYPDVRDAYTYWSYMFQARQRNAGWRIDYFCVSRGMELAVKDVVLHKDVLGSDHCPVELQIDIE
jgi:exodeoxyribonuclease-3